MKIGILTFHHTTNYGATLQAYALSEVLKRQNHDVEVVDYRPQVAVKHYRKKIFNPVKPKSGKIPLKRKIKYSSAGLLKYFRMQRFLERNITLSKTKILHQAELKRFWATEKYDVVICGSDQVWCIDSMRGFNSAYFLDFPKDVQKARKVSYSASCGTTKTWGTRNDEICSLISDFDAISVRDTNSYQLVNQTCGKSPTIVLDPTFLIDFNELLRPSLPIQKPYLLLYIEGGLNKEQREFVKAIASTQNLKIISIGDPIKLGENRMYASPIDWVNYFHGASYIATNFFHGTIFSIKFNRQFTSFFKESKAGKTPDLLKKLKLESRLLDKIGENSVEEQLSPIDYVVTNKVIEDEVARSKLFLKEALTASVALPQTKR